jgi:hypothetical protein
VPLHDIIPIPQATPNAEEGPQHYSRLARQFEGLYVNILEKPLKKREREREKKKKETSSSYASKVSKAKSKMDQEEDNNSILSFLEVDQLIQLGKDSGFDDKDEGELLEATISVAKGV